MCKASHLSCCSDANGTYYGAKKQQETPDELQQGRNDKYKHISDLKNSKGILSLLLVWINAARKSCRRNRIYKMNIK